MADWGTRSIRGAQHPEGSHSDKAVEPCFWENNPSEGARVMGDSSRISHSGTGGLWEELDPTKEAGVRQDPTLVRA